MLTKSSNLSMKIAYHAARVIFGGWWLFSGLMHFFWPEIQPLGDEKAAIDFTLALMDSGLFDWIKVLEVILGLSLLANRAMPLTIIAMAPINIVILYWNFVLDTGWTEWIFGALTIVFSAIIAWPWRRYFWPIFGWNGTADFSNDLGLPD